MSAQRVAGIAVLILLATCGAASAAAQPEEAGTVRLAVGEVYAAAADGSRRALHDDDVLYAGDTLSTGADSYLDLDLDDDGRLLLRPDTQFQIESFHFVPEAHPDDAPPTAAASDESAFFRLIKGGLRIVSGLIGHVQHERYRLDTPVATIGVRGTEYDVRYCTADCGDEAADTGRPPADGLYTGVNKGAIAVTNRGGETVSSAGQYSYVHDAAAPAQLLKTPPAALRHMDLPDKYKQLEKERERRGLHHRNRDRDRHRRRRHRGPGGG